MSKRYMLICKVKEGKPGITCIYLNNSSNAISVIYEVLIHKDSETNQAFWVMWENALSFTLFPAVKHKIMERIIYNFRGLHLFLLCNTNIACTPLYNSLDLVFVFHS